jgi:hypothetical protein
MVTVKPDSFPPRAFLLSLLISKKGNNYYPDSKFLLSLNSTILAETITPLICDNWVNIS